MADYDDEMMRTSTDVMTELVSKARESVAAGESRRSFFTKTAKIAGATALGSAGVGLLQPVAMQSAIAKTTGNSDTLQGILDIAATAESLAITFYYQALQNQAGLPNVNSAANRNYFQAALIQEYTHLLYLTKLGGKPLQAAYHFPTNMFTDETVFFPTSMLLEEYFISAYLAAAIDFSGAVSSGITTANPYALGFAVQVLGVECEHRALLNVAANVNPPNDRLLEHALLKTVNDAVAPLTPFLSGGSGFSGPVGRPSQSDVNTIAQPYGFSFFPRPKIV